MNKKNLEILGLTEGATEEDIEQAYSTLRAKYMEERFLDGEAGNNAAKMLGKIETARDELIAELNEQVKFEEGTTETGDAYAHVEQLIKDGNLQDAQRALDAFNERTAEWHYLQSVVFYRKNWINESKKQLEIAMRLDAGNEKYKVAYKKLADKIDYDANKNARENNGGSVYQGQDMNYPGDNQMGDFCTSCAECCALNACLNCMCNSCFRC
ncbi:MAG: hypothetical protein ACI4VK_02990 [Candidatus Coproplasma sp.]